MIEIHIPQSLSLNQFLSLHEIYQKYEHEEETVIPKHTIYFFGQAGMSRKNRLSFVREKRDDRNRASTARRRRKELERSSEVSL